MALRNQLQTVGCAQLTVFSLACSVGRWKHEEDERKMGEKKIRER
jgi:hypothetical protein